MYDHFALFLMSASDDQHSPGVFLVSQERFGLGQIIDRIGLSPAARHAVSTAVVRRVAPSARSPVWVHLIAVFSRVGEKAYMYGSISACSPDQASVQWAGIPPSGVNVVRVVRWDVRSLRTRRASARAECQRIVDLPL
jgi:hypothetical protein